MQRPEEEEKLSIEEVLDELDITRSTLYRYFRMGLLARINHGGRVWIRRQDLDDYWERRRAAGSKRRAQAERANSAYRNAARRTSA